MSLGLIWGQQSIAPDTGAVLREWNVIMKRHPINPNQYAILLCAVHNKVIRGYTARNMQSNWQTIDLLDVFRDIK